MLEEKFDSPEFRSILTNELKIIFDLFKKNNYEIKIAGGAVRDLLMGKFPDDVDLATTATPEQMKEMFKHEHIRMINTNGEKHGTITVRINDTINYEITTLRIDLITNGRHAEVQFTDDWRLDANRRDLTTNSIFLEPDGTVVDFFNGYDDIKKHRIRFVGDPDTRIKEDYLRILRYFRFYSRICLDEYSHDHSALNAIKENASGLAGIAGERIWVEFKKIVCSKFADSILKHMKETHVLENIGLPGDCNLDEYSRVYSIFHDDLENIPSPITMVCALLHSHREFDIINKRLRFSNDEKKMAEFILAHRDAAKSFKLDHEKIEDNLRPFKMILVDNVKDAKVHSRMTELLKYINKLDYVPLLESWPIPLFPIGGNELAARQVPKGPIYTKVLESLRQKWKHDFDLDTGEKTIAKLLEFCDELINGQCH